MSAQQSPPFRRRHFGRVLRELREAARMSMTEVCARIEFSAARLSRMETGHTAPDIVVVKGLLDLYGLTVNEWEPYLQLAREAKKKGWWQEFGISARAYVTLEAAASTICNYGLGAIPGLMQTEDYARTLFVKFAKRQEREWLENQVRVRMIRKERLYDDTGPLEFAAIIDETALIRPVGDVVSQLKHLLELAALPTVCLQVLPLSASPHVGMDGSFSVLSFTEPDEPDIAHVEYVCGRQQIEKTTEVDACKQAFNKLRSEALTPTDSTHLIEEMLTRWQEQ